MPLTRDFALTRPLPLFALAIVTVAVSVAAYLRLQRAPSPGPNPVAGLGTSPPTVLDHKERTAPLSLRPLFGKIALYPPAGSPWFLTADDAANGDLLVASEDSAVTCGAGELFLRTGSRVRAWQGATSAVVLLEQGELFVDGTFEIRSGASVLVVKGALGLAAPLKATLLRGTATLDGKPLAPDSEDALPWVRDAKKPK